MTSTPEWAYIGRDAAGLVVVARVDDQTPTTWKAVHMWMAEGLTAQRVPVLWARQYFGLSIPFLGDGKPEGAA